ncbi:MAG: HAMP domain-containing histidine kinase [Verrucomicrobia bacterium]|nr:HAMP domain-containing histidine kinase [Verrucomicrobiota bacterium]
MLIVSATMLLALYFADRSLTGRVAADLERDFNSELAKLQLAEAGRRAALLERCRTLVRKPRIRAAFEDDALDLLYPNAEDELRDILVPRDDSHPRILRAQFYRFLDSRGAVIPPPNLRTVGALSAAAEARLALPRLPPATQVGFLHRPSEGHDDIALIMATPIISTETGETLGALVLGFDPADRPSRPPATGMRSGLWFGEALHSPALSPRAAAQITAQIGTVLAAGADDSPPIRLMLDEEPHLLFSQPLNPGSLYPPVHEICAYPLAQLARDQRRLRWQILGTGSALLLLGLAASHLASQRLSRPVERLAVDSEEDRQQRARAEAALELTHAELQRSARFSADASHQLKTPVTVLRAGLEELLAREHLSPAECQEISALIHQTFRLSSLIDDLLLLSRMDAGRLKLAFTPVNLSQLIEASLDDLSALPDEFGVEVETDFPPDLHVSGEKRYTSIILQNLLENARKYNRPGGRIHLRATVEEGRVRLVVRNSGRPIPPEAQPRIFERFHRGTVGENVPGYGLGLNLARELARLHQGELRLVRSDETGTEFEATFRHATAPA